MKNRKRHFYVVIDGIRMSDSAKIEMTLNITTTNGLMFRRSEAMRGAEEAVGAKMKNKRIVNWIEFKDEDDMKAFYEGS